MTVHNDDSIMAEKLLENDSYNKIIGLAYLYHRSVWYDLALRDPL